MSSGTYVGRMICGVDLGWAPVFAMEFHGEPELLKLFVRQLRRKMKEADAADREIRRQPPGNGRLLPPRRAMVACLKVVLAAETPSPRGALFYIGVACAHDILRDLPALAEAAIWLATALKVGCRIVLDLSKWAPVHTVVGGVTGTQPAWTKSELRGVFQLQNDFYNMWHVHGLLNDTQRSCPRAGCSCTRDNPGTPTSPCEGSGEIE